MNINNVNNEIVCPYYTRKIGSNECYGIMCVNKVLKWPINNKTGRDIHYSDLCCKTPDRCYNYEDAKTFYLDNPSFSKLMERND